MSRQLELLREVASLDALFSMLEEEFENHEVDERSAYCIKLTAEELFTNMVRHNVGGGDRIDVGLDITPARIRLELTDHEVEPFDPNTVAPVDVELPVESRRPGGLGMHLVRSLVDRVSYQYEDRTLTVSVVKKLAARRFAIQRSGDCIRLSGRLDAAEADRADAVLSRVDDSAVVDFRDLAYISSAGIGVLFAAQKRLLAAGKGLKLVHLNPHIREVFEIAGFDSVFEIE